jgi:hypothetical protein
MGSLTWMASARRRQEASPFFVVFKALSMQDTGLPAVDLRPVESGIPCLDIFGFTVLVGCGSLC